MVMFSFSLIRIYTFLTMGLAIVALSAASLILSARIDSRDVKIDALSSEIGQEKADIVRWRAAWNESQMTVGRLQKQIDEADAMAQRLRAQQTTAVIERQLESRASQNRSNSILLTLKDQADVHSMVKNSNAGDGFDPVVLAGIHWLQCLQSVRVAGGNPTECQGRVKIFTDRSVSATAATRARHYIPTVNQQLWLLGLVYRFRDWGEACYADKEAIANDQSNISIGR
jgi:hypothetical protein